VKESERWRKLAEAVHNGDGFVGASIDLVNNEEFERAPLGGRTGKALIYGKAAQKADVLYALLLAEEAEEDERELEETFDAVVTRLKEMPAIPQPFVMTDALTAGGMCPTVTYLSVAPMPASFAWADPEPFPAEKEELKPVTIEGYMERRKSWTEKWNEFKARWL
jgi:hypothetical protein